MLVSILVCISLCQVLWLVCRFVLTLTRWIYRCIICWLVTTGVDTGNFWLFMLLRVGKWTLTVCIVWQWICILFRIGWFIVPMKYPLCVFCKVFPCDGQIIIWTWLVCFKSLPFLNRYDIHLNYFLLSTNTDFQLTATPFMAIKSTHDN